MKTYVYITPYFPNPKWHSGIFCYDFVRAIKGYDRVVVFMPGGNENNDYEFRGVHVYRFPTRSFPSNALAFVHDNYNRRSFLQALLRANVNPSDVAVAHANVASYGIFPLAIKRINPRCKTVLHHHDLRSFGFSLGRLRHFWLHKVISYFYYRNIHEQIDLHVFVSSAAKRSFLSFPDTSWSKYDDYKKLGRGLGWLRPVTIKDSIVVHNGVDPSVFNSDGGRKSARDRFKVGMVGNLIDVKNHIQLIKAVEILKNRIPSIELEMLGTDGFGTCYSDCCKYIEERNLGSYVRFLPNADRDRLPEFYRSLDLFVLPSFFEGFGCVLVESYACGTPFISAAGQGIDDLLDEDGRRKWTFIANDVASLIDRICWYYEHREHQCLIGDIHIEKIMSAYLAKLR